MFTKEEKENNDIIKDNKEIKEINEINEINEKNTKEESVKNPFDILVKKEEEKKGNNNNKVNNKNISLFSNMINKNKDKSLFDTVDNSKSLFGNLNSINDNKEKKESNQTSLFGNISLFSNNAGKSLFDKSDNNNNNSNTALFNNIIKNPFSDIKGDIFAKSLFNNTNKNENNNNNEKGNSSLFEGDDNNSEKSDEGDKPKTKYVTEPLKAQDYSEYSKLFNLNINNLFLYNKNEKKYISKGSGFFSIEKTKDEKNEKHQAVVVFRNHAGNKLVEGFIDIKFNKCDIISKDFNYVVCFGIIMMNENIPDIELIKIPFKNEDNAKELKNSFEKALEFIQKK